MRYRDIIDFEDETEAEREVRYRLQYGCDDTDDAQDAETELLLAKAAKLRAEALAEVKRIEEETEALVIDAEQELIALLLPRERSHPDE